MRTTPTSSSFGSVSRVALFDEIEKISETQLSRKERLKRHLKHGLGYAAGYTAGHLTGMVADKALSHVFRDKYPKWSPQFKHMVLFPALGAATVGLQIAHQHAAAKRKEHLERE